ncbi:29063_t:CDS:2 [Gigaspora margarita]|uniref:29063_t:CDS:1 n=1 Tax=Gigaspora margarita TaxID=4874 RepID=A0ABM8VVT0_GIGMA|nr:29063_t:CDS:2 [Gigaspora margarita]
MYLLNGSKEKSQSINHIKIEVQNLREELKDLKKENNNKIPFVDTLQTNFANKTKIAHLTDDIKILRLREEGLIVKKVALILKKEALILEKEALILENMELCEWKSDIKKGL